MTVPVVVFQDSYTTLITSYRTYVSQTRFLTIEATWSLVRFKFQGIRAKSLVSNVCLELIGSFLVYLFIYFLFIAIFFDSYVQGKRRKEVSWNPCKAQTLTGQTTITGRIPYSFRTVMWVLYRPLLNHDRADAGDGTYGLSSLSEKTRKSTLLQMS